MRLAAITLLLLVSACGINPRRYAPIYPVPATRAAAARQLHDALAHYALGPSEVIVTETELRWHQMRRLTEKRTVMVQRSLDFGQIEGLTPPHQPTESWVLEIDASGGRVSFEFKTREPAARAHAALKRLRRTD